MHYSADKSTTNLHSSSSTSEPEISIETSFVHRISKDDVFKPDQVLVPAVSTWPAASMSTSSA